MALQKIEVLARKLFSRIVKQVNSETAYETAGTVLRSDGKALASQVLSVYQEYQKRTDGPTNVITFARMVDPSIPVAKDQYRNHRIYKAVQRYIRIGQGFGNEGSGSKAITATLPQAVVDRLLALAFDLASPADVMSGLTLALKTAGHAKWTGEQSAIVKARAEQADALALTQPATKARKAKAA